MIMMRMSKYRHMHAGLPIYDRPEVDMAGIDPFSYHTPVVLIPGFGSRRTTECMLNPKIGISVPVPVPFPSPIHKSFFRESLERKSG